METSLIKAQATSKIFKGPDSMSVLLVLPFQASTLTCDEIPEGRVIKVQDQRMSWKKAKERYFRDWHYNFVPDASHRIANLQKYRQCWEKHGSCICDHFRQERNIEINYSKKIEQLEKVHFIIALDASGSMRGERRFMNAKAGAVDFLKKGGNLSETADIDHAASVILFNGEATTVVQRRLLKERHFAELNSSSAWGWTSFAAALAEVNKQVSEAQEHFDRQIVLFYSDGEDKYPRKEMQVFIGLQRKIPLDFFAICEMESAPVLQQMCEKSHPEGHADRFLVGHLCIVGLLGGWCRDCRMNLCFLLFDLLSAQTKSVPVQGNRHHFLSSWFCVRPFFNTITTCNNSGVASSRCLMWSKLIGLSHQRNLWVVHFCD